MVYWLGRTTALTYPYSFLDWSWLVFLHKEVKVQVKVLNT